MKAKNVFLHLGDFGDILGFLPTIRALGGGHLCIGHKPHPGKGHPGFGRESMRGARYEAILPLLLEQPYIYGARWTDDFAGVTHDASSFRLSPRGDDNLAQWQARHFKVTISEEPWLIAEPDERFRGRTIIARSARYHEISFPWPRIMRENPDALFVGLPDEHAAFQHRYGEIEYLMTHDLWELACAMAASKMVVSNQTAAFWLAIGLGVDTIQETYSPHPDSIIRRPNAKYFYRHETTPVKRHAALKTQP